MGQLVPLQHGRWPTPAVNELLDAIRFQFSGETSTQGQGLPRFTHIALLDEPEQFCKTYQDFQAHKDSWKKTKG
jgi:hypothetical protein